MTSATTTTDDIVAWISSRVSEYGAVDAGPLDAGSVLAELGFDSVYALTLCGDIEDHYGLEVEPTIVWDHPTIGALAQAIRDRVESS
ncbi:acyl carrier protein [Cellulomonas sp. URHD0024]|uniref:acyl carrier protein n=1 Tax=Cellulomonas sp. URHD0024 TaxID=1302620 RepID=UPI000404CEEB|nr:acyl carrier protein [Cellulomonas sp. URHD0024]